MNYIIVYGSVKDSKLQRGNIKKMEDVIIREDGHTVGQLIKENDELKNDYLKLQEEFLKYKTETLALFNKLNNNQEILVRKVNKLENSTATLLSNTTD